MKIDLDELRAELAETKRKLAITEAFLALVDAENAPPEKAESRKQKAEKPRAGAVCKGCGQQPGFCACQPKRNGHAKAGKGLSRREMGLKAGELMRSLLRARKVAEPFDFVKLREAALAAEPSLAPALDDKSVGNFLNRARVEGLIVVARIEGHKKLYHVAGVSVPRDAEVALAR